MDVTGIVIHVHELLQNGHLEVLQWARNNGCDWDSDTCAMLLTMDIWKCSNGLETMDVNGIVDTCAYAAENGHLEVLQWARNNGCEWD